ncbi:thioredoxin domain-containing protein, partial [Leuconostoc citreum]|uniref:thioredoxin domain-containing protein n=1 Tax=Leuconostoc citreum TaxID=33964 RepID=UPI0021517136
MFKKYLMYSLGLIISLFFFNNIASANATETNQITSPSIEKQLSVYNDNVKELKHISYNQLNSIYDSGKASYIYFGRPSCPHCRDFAPVIKEVNRMKGYNIYYYNTDSSDFGPVARNLVYNIIKIPGVPTILCLKNQKIVSGWVGGGISAQELNQRLFGLDDNSNSNHQDQPSDTPVNTQAEQTSATPVNTQVKQTSATPVNTQVKQTSATPV